MTDYVLLQALILSLGESLDPETVHRGFPFSAVIISSFLLISHGSLISHFILHLYLIDIICYTIVINSVIMKINFKL